MSAMKIFSMFGDIFIKDNDVDTKLDKMDKKANKLNISFSGLSNEAGKSIRAVNKEFELWSTKTDKAANSSEYLNKKLTSLNKAMELMNKDISKTKDEYDKVVDEFGEGSSRAEKLKDKISKLELSHAKLNNEIKDTQKEVAKVGDKFEQFGNELGKVNSTMTKWGVGIAGTIGVISGALFKLTEKTTETASAINDMSERTGLSTKTLQELQFATGQVGVNFESITSAVGFLTRSMNGAEEGSDKLKEAFGRLKVDTRDITTGELKSMDNVFMEVVDKLSGMKNETERNALAMQVFGKGAMEIVPLLNQGSAGIEELRKKAHELGLVMDDEAIKATDEFGDKLDIIKSSGDAAKNKLVQGLLPAISKVADYLIDNMPKIQQKAEELGGKIGDILLSISDRGPAFYVMIGMVEALTAAWIIQKGVLAALAINKGINWIADQAIAFQNAVNTKGTIAYTVAQGANTVATGLATGINFIFGTSLQLTGKHLLIVAGAIAIVVGLIYLLTRGFNSAKSEIEQTMNSMSSFNDVANSAANNKYNQYANKINGSHRSGLARVPFDGYIGKLHKEEEVLTADDPRNRNNPNFKAGGDTFIIKGDVKVVADNPKDFMQQVKILVRQGV